MKILPISNHPAFSSPIIFFKKTLDLLNLEDFNVHRFFFFLLYWLISLFLMISYFLSSLDFHWLFDLLILPLLTLFQAII